MTSQLAREVPISVFDTSPIVAGSSAREALHNTVDLARLAEDLGYSRYWVAEHHAMKGVASCATAVLIAQIASATERIRVGSGAVLLPNHPPLLLAEEFGTLEAFHPGRIDFGIGRALGGNKKASERVRSEADRTSLSFDDQLTELLTYFDDAQADCPVRAVPAIGNKPPIWLLGSTTFSARLAGSLGLPYAFGFHINPGGAVEALDEYRATFRPTGDLDRPRVIVSVPVIAADTDQRAEWLAGSIRLKVLSRATGKSILLPSPSDAAEHTYMVNDHSKVKSRFSHYVIGSAETVERKLQSVLDMTRADELAIQGPIYAHVDRRRSYQLVAQVRLRSALTTGRPHITSAPRS